MTKFMNTKRQKRPRPYIAGPIPKTKKNSSKNGSPSPSQYRKLVETGLVTLNERKCVMKCDGLVYHQAYILSFCTHYSWNKLQIHHDPGLPLSSMISSHLTKKLPVGVLATLNDSRCELMNVCNSHPMQSVFPPHARCSQDRFQSSMIMCLLKMNA